MKIGILTHPLRFNYGGLLQNYALQSVLRQMGHEPITLDVPHIRKINKKTFFKDILKRLYYRYILHLQVHIFEEWRYNRLYPIMMQNLQPFINSNIEKIEVKNFRTLSERDFDALIVGSDQVWRRIYMPDIYKEYLNFAENWEIKRISYAASFGTDKWEYTPEETTECKRLIQKFDAVSVREVSGISLCKKHFDVNAIHVADPTLLLTKDDYCKLFEGKDLVTHRNGLLTYFLDQRQENETLTNYIAKFLDLYPFNVNSKYDTPGFHPIEECIQPSVESWLKGFNDAKFVLTDSFHACVFAIIFNKHFFVFGNTKRGLSRLESLLGMFGLSNRMIYNIEDLKNKNMVIDWKQINAILRDQRETSMRFLQENLIAN